MRAYRFRLEEVARVRALQERLAGHSLADATAGLRRAEGALASARASLAALDAPQGETSPGAVSWTRDQSDRMGATRLLRTRDVDEAVEEVASARQAWERARKRCAMIERLDARQRALWQEEFDRSEAKALDDLVATRYAIAKARP